MRIYNLGIIGFGGMAGHHFKQLGEGEQVSVRGVYDINPERVHAAVDKGLIGYRSK